MSEGVRNQEEPGHLAGPFLDEFHLAICIPSTLQWHTGFAMSLLNCVQMLNTSRIGRRQSYTVKNISTAILEYSREKLVVDALLEEAPAVTHILFLDSDMVFPAETVHWLAWRREAIVMANYVRRGIPAVPVTKSLEADLPVATRTTDTGLEAVRCGGLGVALFERAVFDSVPRPWFKIRWREDGATPGDLRFDSEDTLLFVAAREKGFKVYIDHDLSKHVKHIGQFEYENAMADPADWGVPDAVAV